MPAPARRRGCYGTAKGSGCNDLWNRCPQETGRVFSGRR